MEQDQIEKSILEILIKNKTPLLAREICVLLNLKHPGHNFRKPEIRSIIWGKNLRKEIKFNSVSFKYFLINPSIKVDKLSYNNCSTSEFNESKKVVFDQEYYKKLKKILEEEELRISNPSIRLFIENVLFRLKND